jgi:hypothetical protein
MTTNKDLYCNYYHLHSYSVVLSKRHKTNEEKHQILKINKNFDTVIIGKMFVIYEDRKPENINEVMYSVCPTENRLQCLCESDQPMC